MAKKVCISGYYGCNNYGDETILNILVENLKNIEPELDITVFSLNKNAVIEQLSVKSVNSFDIKSVLNAIFKCDYLISGGGSLLQDTTSRKSLIYYLFVIITAQFLRKKTFIFAQGIGPIKNTLLRNLTMLVLKKTDYITVRDDNSFNLLKEHGIIAKKCSDPVWNINIPKVQKTGKIGIQLRNFPLITDDFLKELAKNINKFYANKEILLLSLQNKMDLFLCENLKNFLMEINPKISVKVVQNTSNEKITEILCSLNKIIAMRYHACLVAIKAGVDVLPVNYDIKVEQLAKEFDLRCINSIQDIEKELQIFSSSKIKYDLEKIRAKKFDFSEMNKKF